MTDTPTDAPAQGNPIVPTPPPALKDVPFPILLLAAVIVGASVYYVAQIDSKSGWLLAFLILLAIAFAHPTFSNELTQILSSLPGSTPNTQATSTDNSSNGVATPTSALGG